MGYRNLQSCLRDLESTGQLVRVDDEVDAELEAAEIHRRCFRAGGPAILFSRVKGCQFPMVSNVFGTLKRAHFLFRDTLDSVRRLIELKVDPNEFWRRPFRYWKTPLTALSMLPRQVRRGAVIDRQTSVSQLPQLKSWPNDGGAFITLPMVYTENVEQLGILNSNLGMYRIQLSGGQYQTDQEIGLHYQIHRGIGVHHTAARRHGQPFRVNIFVGGTPSMTLAAVMPLPEGMSELTFAGALAGHRIPMIRARGPTGPSDMCHLLPVYAEADFCIAGTVIEDKKLPEGPFGDHLGYYSLAHDFPVLRVEKVFHRRDAVWPFTVVGRPPQEDTVFGQLIHDLTGPIIPNVIPGLHAVHAVDDAGVHPLLLAIGSERYAPFSQLAQPQELLTQANAILGMGQMSLAKYLWIINRDDDPQLEIHDIDGFFRHVLKRVDWRRDLHFHTRTTIDTLDYSGGALNAGSKVVIATVGPDIRQLPNELPSDLQVSEGFYAPQLCFPGVLAVSGPGWAAKNGQSDIAVQRFCDAYDAQHSINRFPFIVIVDDSEFVARNLHNFLWVVFTRSNPAADVYGIRSSIRDKHWGCEGSLVIDARSKPHHAPPLSEDPEVSRRVDAMAARGGPLSRWL